MISKITITFAPARKPYRRPRIGDTKVIRGVLHVRRQCTVREHGRIFYQVAHGRPVCDWVPVAVSP